MTPLLSLLFYPSQYLAVDVRRLNASLLRWFREGVAAALGVPAGHVHINRLNVRHHSTISLYVTLWWVDLSGASCSYRRRRMASNSSCPLIGGGHWSPVPQRMLSSRWTLGSCIATWDTSALLRSPLRCVCVFDVKVPPSSFMKFVNIVTLSIGHDRNSES